MQDFVENVGRISAGFFAILSLLLLARCAGSIAGDALAGPEKLAHEDDAYCRSIGTNMGSPEYANCRMVMTQRRDAKHAAGAQLASQALSDFKPVSPNYVVGPNPPIVMQPPRNTTCQTFGNTTNCQSQ
jgi:hypothetical protein